LVSIVDQIRIIQQHSSCHLEKNNEFVDELMQRINYFKNFDLNQLAENNFQDHHTQKLLNHNDHHQHNHHRLIKHLIYTSKRKFL
jgi:hypothetical protein